LCNFRFGEKTSAITLSSNELVKLLYLIAKFDGQRIRVYLARITNRFHMLRLYLFGLVLSLSDARSSGGRPFAFAPK
jgi:hypothetical protein